MSAPDFAPDSLFPLSCSSQETLSAALIIRVTRSRRRDWRWEVGSSGLGGYKWIACRTTCPFGSNSAVPDRLVRTPGDAGLRRCHAGRDWIRATGGND
ncbi:hypothetical protein IG631_18055 [Alternaria alternata]|nr:hypothetical protein IG631_18055 [Alternaria alternata]